MKKLLHAAVLLMTVSCGAFADGGKLLLQQQAGPLTIRVFNSPETLRIGPADLSVLVQRTAGGSPVLDAKVHFNLRRAAGESISEIYAPATHADATNKLLYAARVNFTEKGTWRVSVSIDASGGHSEVASVVDVLPALPPLRTYWPWFALVPLAVFLFALNRWLRSRRINHPPTHGGRRSGH